MFYGWRMVGVTFVTLFISVGFMFYSYSVFFPALEADFGGSRFLISLGISAMSVSMAVLAPFLGRAVDTMPIRKIMATGGILMLVGFSLASQIGSIWHYMLLLMTFLGVGSALIGQLPSTTLVSNWFVRRRGTALGIATMGVSSSGIVIPHLTTYLIAHIGWRSTFMVYGLLAGVIVVPLVWIAVVNRPEDMGLYPDGLDEPPPPVLGNGEPQEENGSPHALGMRHLSTKTIMLERNFWAITVSVGMCFFSMGSILIHTVRLAMDRGYTAGQGATILSCSAGMGVLGKVLFGWMSDHIDTRLAFWTSMTFQVIGIAIYWKASTLLGMAAGAGVFGLGMGGVVPLWATMTGEAFGRENFGRVTGLMSPAMLPIQAVGVPYTGYIYDRMGSYDIAFMTFFGMYTLAALSLLGLRRRDVDQRVKKELGIEEV